MRPVIDYRPAFTAPRLALTPSITRAPSNNGTTVPSNFGVMVEGAEYSWVGYASLADLENIRSEGVTFVRLPIAWEMMQPTLNGPLNSTYLAGLTTFISNATSLGIGVLVDIHDYGRYDLNWAADAAANYGTEAPNGPDASVIGSAAVPISAFASFWQQLATALNGNQGVAGYDIMNEPNNMPTPETWPDAAQAAVNAIRSVDMKTPIYVEGDQWASAANWEYFNANLQITDPANNIIYEAHQYFDNGSGQYAQTYEQLGNTPSTGVQDIAPFIQWLKVNNYRGFIGETGVPGYDPLWIPLMNNVLNDLRVNGISATIFNYEMPDSSPQWWASQIEDTAASWNQNVAPVTGVLSSQLALIFKYSSPVITSHRRTPMSTSNSIILGGASAGCSAVSVFDQGNFLGSTTANIRGSWQFITGALSVGTHVFTASAADPSGNISEVSEALSLTVTSAPSARISQLTQ
jgi:endoglucanase